MKIVQMLQHERTGLTGWLWWILVAALQWPHSQNLMGRHAYLWCLQFMPTAATMPATSPPGSPGSLPGYIPRTFSTSLKLSPIALTASRTCT